MIVVTTSEVAGSVITDVLGMVRGSSIRTRHLGRDVIAVLRNIAGGEVYEYTIDLGPVGALVRAGTRLRLDISSSDFPQWDRNLNTGRKPMGDGPGDSRPATQVVFHDRSRPTRVVIPVLT